MRAQRFASASASTNALADTPTLYHVNVIPAKPFLAVPETSSERREYVPIAWLDPPTVPSNSLRLTTKASNSTFALLTSAMHMSWLRHVGGRLKSDFRYSIGLVYDTFPLPPGGTKALAKLEALGSEVLEARAEHPDEPLANLYDPLLMPQNLRRAHRRADVAVDRLYRRKAFTADRERAEHLLGLYESAVASLQAA